MTSEHQEIKALADLAKRPLAKKKFESQLLEYLAKHWSPTGSEDLEIPRIAVEVRKVREVNKEAREYVRQGIHRLRAALDDCFLEGSLKKSPRRLELPTGVPYVLRVVPNDKAFEPHSEFWEGYFSSHYPSVIWWAEPLVFYLKEQRVYVRFLDRNCEESEPDKVNAMRPPAGHRFADEQMVPCFHYQSSGDVAAVYKLQNWFKQNDANVTARATRDSGGQNIHQVNTIVIGNQRTNQHVSTLHRNCDFTVEADHVKVENPDPARGEKPKYEDYRPSEALNLGDAKGWAYAVLTHHPNLNSRTRATVIAANHGRAIEKVTEYLIDPRQMTDLFEKEFRHTTPNAWPESFQVLFKVRIARGMIFEEPEIVTSRVYQNADKGPDALPRPRSNPPYRLFE